MVAVCEWIAGRWKVGLCFRPETHLAGVEAGAGPGGRDGGCGKQNGRTELRIPRGQGLGRNPTKKKIIQRAEPLSVVEHASNTELLANIAGKSVAGLLERRYGGLMDLAQASFDELHNIKGIGEAQAAAIKSAFLLGQRLSRESYAERPLVDTPERVADLLREQTCAYTVENCHVLFLNTRRRLLGVQNISQGTLDTLLVHPREVFATAIAKHAAAIVLVHNHPSGDPTPSDGDLRVTRELIQAGQVLKIELLDHVIMGRRVEGRSRDWVSLRELGFFSPLSPTVKAG